MVYSSQVRTHHIIVLELIIDQPMQEQVEEAHHHAMSEL